MKFTNGYWLDRDGFSVLRAVEVRDVVADPEAGTLTVYAATKRVRGRGDTLNAPLLTVTYSAPAPGVVRVRIAHFDGGVERRPRFTVAAVPGFVPQVRVDDETGELVAGDLVLRVRRGPGWLVELRSGGRLLTSSTTRSIGAATGPDGTHYVHEQLTLAPGELVYGLGERFGPVVKNGQTVDIWNLDGGTSSEQAYKNVPFYLTSRGYGVLVDH
ncbi:MAG: alpha-xylosidase, partial [Cellulomonas sp.]|nr:alpha-xylosidase [Cellulomonas sp.]